MPAMERSPTAGSGSGKRAGRQTVLFLAAVAAAVALHTALLFYFEPPKVIFAEKAIDTGDFQTHFHQALRVIEGIEGWGQTWVYDVNLLAGYPHGTIFDADNKGWELWTYALYRLGLPVGTAFNMFLLLAHLLLLPVVYGSARLFGLNRWGALAAMVMGSLLWFFDSFLHFCWIGGMVAYAMASYLFLLPLALFYRFIQPVTGSSRLHLALLTALLMGVGHIVHPYTFFIMLAPMAVLYLRASRDLGRVRQAAVLAIPVIVIGMNAYWLLVAIRFWHYILDSGFCGQTTLGYFPADFFGLLLDPTNTGLIGTRTGFRFLCLGAALATLWSWRREGDSRFGPFSLGIGLLLLLAYFGGYLEPVTQIQPYRHVAAAAFLSTIPAAALFERLGRQRVLQRLPGLGRAAIIVLLLPALQHLARDVIYFFPEELPEVAPFVDGNRPMIAATGFPAHRSYRHTDPHPYLYLLVRWAEKREDRRGRILVQGGMDGEALAWMTDAEVLGGFQLLNLKHAHANLFRLHFQGEVDEQYLRRYLRNYAVRWVVITSPRVWFDDKPGLLRLAARFAQYRIYRVEMEPDLFQQGSGEVKARTNRIEVRGTDPGQPLVLRYHWLETLVCEPDCELVPADNPMGGVDFIRIPAPHPRDLVIRNAY
jgi:hypothetical protein